jgi:hypothetical protein
MSNEEDQIVWCEGFETVRHQVKHYGEKVKDEVPFYCSDCNYRYLNSVNQGKMGTVH